MRMATQNGTFYRGRPPLSNGRSSAVALEGRLGVEIRCQLGVPDHLLVQQDDEIQT